MVKGLKDPNNLIRQIYLFVYKYKGNFDQVIQNIIIGAHGNVPVKREWMFDNYMAIQIGPPPDVNDERIKIFTIRYYNGEIKGLI